MRLRLQGGFLLAFGLMIMVLLLVAGLGFLGKQADRYRAATAAEASSQALEVAMAGLEDARVKLMKDFKFPPPGEEDLPQYSYTEILHDPSGQAVGSYMVTIDTRWKASPSSLFKIEVWGYWGDPANQPISRRRLTAEWDYAEFIRGTEEDLKPTINPHAGQLMHFQDHGGL